MGAVSAAMNDDGAHTPAELAAHGFAARSWRPFPLDYPSLPVCASPHRRGPCDGKRGKHPVGGWGTQTATAPTAGMLSLWFGSEPRNIGIACGPSGLCVLDEDEDEALTKLADQLGEALPTTYRVMTARGWHWYFADPDNEFGNTAGVLADHGIDVRGGHGAGGYVVAAGSMHQSGVKYLAEDSAAEVVPLPEWIKTLIRTPSAAKASQQGAKERPEGGWDNDPRHGRAEVLRAQYERHLSAVHALAVPADQSPNGGEFRHALYLAALDGWRLVDCELIEEFSMLSQVREAIRAVWRDDPEDGDRTIVYDEARDKAKASPWVVLDPPGTPGQNGQNDAVDDDPEGSGGFVRTSPGEWDSPTPLPGKTDPLPTDALGPTLQPVVEAIGECLQVPTDLPINLALPLITTAAKGGWTVQVDTGWTEPLCIATLSALPSGEMKSPTLRILDAPLRRYERDAQAREKPVIAAQAARKKLAEGRMEEARKQALKGLDGGAQEKAYLEASAKLAEIEIKPLPRWLVDDATPEKFVSLLAEHGAIGAVSAEPGLFGILAGRYSSGAPNLEWLLKATSGETITVDRIGRDSEQVTNPALSIASCIQPGRLVELGSVKTFRESGLLARQFYVIPASAVGEREKAKPVPQTVLDSWEAAITAVAAAGEKRRENPTALALTDQGRVELDAFRAEIEPDLHPGHGKYAGIADWMNKLSGGAVRIAAALTLLGDPDAIEINAATMADAIRIARAYISHTIAAFGMIRPNAELFSQAKQVLAIMRRLYKEQDDRSTVTRREVHRKLRDRAWVESRDSLDGPLRVLVEYGHIRQLAHPAGKPGRPPEVYELHPCHLPQKPGQNGQNSPEEF